VPIFFVISGFLISASYERGASLATYASNRLLRILPGLWCCLIVTVVAASLFGFSFLSLKALAWFGLQLGGAVFTPGFLKPFGFGSYNGSLWTIPIELQFYLLLPLAYFATRRLRSRTAGFVALWAVFLVAGYLFARLSPPLAELENEPLAHKLMRYSFIPHIYLFLTGVLLQRWRAQRSRWIAGKALFWVAGYLAYTRLAPAGPAWHVLGTLLMGVGVISIAYTLPGVAARVLRGNDISYGVYVYHGLIINVLLELGLGGRGRVVGLVVLLALIVGALSWRFVERPFLRRKRVTIHPAGAPVA